MPAAPETQLPRPEAAPAVEEIAFRSRDNTQLFGRLFRAEGARGNAIVVHGYAEHGGRYTEVCERLRACGLNALNYDMRGHGRAEGARGHIESFSDYLEDFDAALGQLEDLAGSLPLLLVGHSNGGLIALRILADPYRVPTKLRAAVLSSPFLRLRLKVSPFKSALAHVASRAFPRLTLPNNLAIEDLTTDPQKLAERRVDTLCHDVASARWFTEAQATQQWVQEFAHRITTPTLWLVSGLDRLADPQASRILQAKLRTEFRYHEFPDMHHEVFNERQRELVFGLLRDFCEAHFQS